MSTTAAAVLYNLVMAAILSTAKFMAMFAATLWGQSQLAFEVTSIRPVSASTRSEVGVRVDGARAEFLGASLASLISRAYRVRSFQVSGPEWMKTTRFNIVAKLPDGASTNQVPEMLQTLLAERFKLIFHRDSKEFPAYALVVGNIGPRITPRPADNASAVESPKPITLEELCEVLALDRPVLDRTGLTGEYMVPVDEFRKMTNSKIANAKASMLAGGAGDPESLMTEALVSAATGFVQTLGLKLETRNLALPLLIVDHLEKTSTEN